MDSFVLHIWHCVVSINVETVWSIDLGVVFGLSDVELDPVHHVALLLNDHRHVHPHVVQLANVVLQSFDVPMAGFHLKRKLLKITKRTECSVVALKPIMIMGE